MSSTAAPLSPSPQDAFNSRRLKLRNPGKVAAFYSIAILAIVAGDVMTVNLLTLLCSWWPWLAAHLWLLIPITLILVGLILLWIYKNRHELKWRVFLAFAVLICIQSLCIAVDDAVERLTGKDEAVHAFESRAQKARSAGLDASKQPAPLVNEPGLALAAQGKRDEAQARATLGANGTEEKDSERRRALWMVVLASTVFGLAWWRAHKLREEVSTYRSLERPEKGKEKPLRGLILLVSPPIFVPEIQMDGQTVAKIIVRVEKEKTGGGSEKETAELAPTDGLDRAIAKMDTLPVDHNWEQLLRSILPLRETVEHVWLIGSAPKGGSPVTKAAGEKADRDDGSWIYLPLAFWFLKAFLRLETKIYPDFPPLNGQTDQTTRTDQAVDFEDFDKLRAHLETCVKEAHQLGLEHDQLAIDVTGGIKMASVVGATLTLNDETLIQYVPTGGNQTARIYDLRSDSPLGLE